MMKTGFAPSLFNNLAPRKIGLFVFIIIIGTYLSLAQENDKHVAYLELNNVTMTTEVSDYKLLAQLIITCISTSIGVLIGGSITFFITKKQIESQSRISYISNILKDQEIEQNFGKFLLRLNIKNKNNEVVTSLIEATKDVWFFLLFSPSKKRYDELVSQINNNKWDEALNTVTLFLHCNW